MALAKPAKADEARAGSGRWDARLSLTVGILLVMYALSLLDRHLLALVVGPVRADLGITEVQIGVLQGFAFAAFYVLCGVPLGWAADLYSRRLIILGGVLFWSLATAATAFAYDFPSMLIARFAVGMGEAALIPAAYSLIGAIAPRAQLSMAMAVFSTGAIFGSGIALIMGGALVEAIEASGIGSLGGTAFEPWQLAFLLVGLAGMPLALLALALPEPGRKADAVGALGGTADVGFLAFLRSRRAFFIPHFLGFSFIYFVSAGGGAWAPTFLERSYGWNMAQVGSSLGIAVLVFGISGFLVAGKVIDRRLARGQFAAPLGYFAVGALAIAFTGGIAPLLGSAAVFAAAYGAIHFFTVCAAAAGTALTLVTPPQFRARVAALFTVVFNFVGAGGGPYAVGVASQEVFGEESLGHALSALYIVGGIVAALCLLLAVRPLRRLMNDGGTS